MLIVKTAVTAAIAGCIAAVLAFGQARVTCASDNGGRQYCNADTRNGVVLVKQLSETRCVQGRTWGFDRGGIWVDRGCRAEFAVNSNSGNRPGYGDRPGYGRPGNGGGPNVFVITCASNNGKRNWCQQNDSNARVRLVKQRSDSKCQEGYSWGTAPGSIWVDHGCRGDFEVRSGR